MGTPASVLPSTRSPGVPAPRAAVVLDQSDMYSGVFSPLVGGEARLVAVLVEYIRSLGDCRIPVQHFLYELLINAMVRRRAFFQLHQLLQYHVVSDSKPLVRVHSRQAHK